MATSREAADLRALVAKAVGTDALIMGSDPSLVVEYLPTGVLPIDVLTQGGLPLGRFTEVYGDWSSMKSYIALKSIASAQRRGMTAALIDTEHSFDPSWATHLGVDVDSLILSNPPNGEMAVDTAEVLVRHKCGLVVFDSVAAALPQDEQNKRLYDERIQPARLAALMSAAMRRLTAANSRTAILWINQTRVNVGVTFGNPESVPGGRALPYYASVRVSIKKAGKVHRSVKVHDGEKFVDGREQTAQRFKATVEKSKLNRPHREVWFDFDFQTGGVDERKFLVAQGLEHGYVQQNGSVWTYKDYTARGRERFKDGMTEEAAAGLEADVRAHHGISVARPAAKRAVRRR